MESMVLQRLSIGMTLLGMATEMKPKVDHRGFTLVEILLYVALMSIMVFSISQLFFTVTGVKIKSRTITEVEQQGVQAMQYMTQTIRNATGVTSPLTGSNGPSLTITVADVSKSPTIFTLVSGTLYVQEAGGATIPLTSSRVVVSALTFQNLSRSSTSRIVRIAMTVQYNSASPLNEYQYSQTFVDSAGIRP
jgi:Tfp pilus assembly protein PilW